MVSFSPGRAVTFLSAGRKSAPAALSDRASAKQRRDTAILEYLRVARELAKEELGECAGPLSVYSSTYLFPIRFQIVENETGKGYVTYKYNSVPMPHWNDLTIRLKVELFQMLCEEWDKSLYTFNPHIHPDLLSELAGKDLVAALRERTKRRLDRIGRLPRCHFFVVEGHDGKGVPKRLHIHGMAAVEDERQANAVRLAMGRAAGQDEKRRSKLPSGNHGKFYRYEAGKSWAGYILKNIDREHHSISRRKFVFSRAAVQVTREFYNFITGR